MPANSHVPPCPPFPSMSVFGVGPVPGLGARSAGGSRWEPMGGGGGGLPSLAEAGPWGTAVWLGFGSNPAIQGGSGGSQESREAWNRRGSSRREAETGRGCEEAGETDGKRGEEPRRRLQAAGGGGALWCPCLPPMGLMAKPAPHFSFQEGHGCSLKVKEVGWRSGGHGSGEEKGETAGELSYLWTCGRGKEKKKQLWSFGSAVKYLSCPWCPFCGHTPTAKPHKGSSDLVTCLTIIPSLNNRYTYIESQYKAQLCIPVCSRADGVLQGGVKSGSVGSSPQPACCLPSQPWPNSVTLRKALHGGKS